MIRFLIALILAFSTLYAGPGTWLTDFELLIFKPTVDQSAFVVSSTNNTFTTDDNTDIFPNGKRFNNDPGFFPGFRISGVYIPCECNRAFDLRFAFFSETNTESVSGPFLFDTIGFPGSGAQSPEDLSYNGTATYRQRFRYYAVDAAMNRLTVNCCPENLKFILGLHFAYVRFNERLASSGFSTSFDDPPVVEFNSNLLRRNSHFWGLGPQFGFDYRYCFPKFCLCGPGFWGFRADVRGALLASYTWADLHYLSLRTGSVGVNLDNQPLWRITPCADVKFGFNYVWPCSCCNVNFEFGYEWLWYSDAVDAITGYETAFAGDTIDLFSSLSLQGPYIALGASF